MYKSILLIGFAACTLVGCSKTKPIDLAFFYMEICPACETYQKAESIAGYVAAAWREHKHVKGRSYNIATPQHVDALRTLIKERGLPDLIGAIPVLIVDSTYYLGYDDIEKAVRHVLAEGTAPTWTE